MINHKVIGRLNSEVTAMAVNYKKLWKLLISRDLKKRNLEAMAQVSYYTMSKLTHSSNITTDVLGHNCKTLGCSLNDIMSLWMSNLTSTVLKFSGVYIRSKGTPILGRNQVYG